MKPVLELLAGTTIAVGMGIGGVALASAALAPTDRPHQFDGLDVEDLWTADPVVVDTHAQDYERLPARYASHVVMSDSPEGPESAASVPEQPSVSLVSQIDIMATASAEHDHSDTALMADQWPAAHIAWCRARYRSYNALDNTYRAYSGEVRDCRSPLQEEMASGGEVRAIAVSSNGDERRTGVARPAHARACAERYRSYRAADNTYQPYGGGPRKQCQLVSF